MSEKHTRPKAEEKPVTDSATVNGAAALIDEGRDKQLTTPLAKLKRKRKLTMDATSISRLGQVVCMAQSELRMVPMPNPAKAGELSETAVLDIVDVISGETYMLICNKLIVSALQRAEPPLTGRYFAMRAGEIAAGKRYRKVDIVELERAE